MGGTEQFIFTLPQSLHVEQVLGRALRRFDEDARYFVSTIVRKTARGQADRNRYVPLRAEHVRSIISYRKAKAVVDQLLATGIVQRRPYQRGVRPFSYRLHERYLDNPHVRQPVASSLIRDKLARFAAQARAKQRKRMLPVHLDLERRQQHLEVSGELARTILGGLPPASNPYDVQGILVADIEEGRFRLTVGNFGRVSNNITSMKRELRRALRYNDAPLVGIDISCCQPALVALLLEVSTRLQGGNNVTSYSASLLPLLSVLVPEFETFPSRLTSSPSTTRFITVCCNGSLFELLGDCLRKKGFDWPRSVIKKRFLADVIAKKKANRWGKEYPSALEDVFRTEFPEVWKFIRLVCDNGWQHQRLIQILQRLESWLVIEQVCRIFMERHPNEFVITLHDAIYVRPQAKQLAVAAFETVFDDLDFHMKLKIEDS